MMKEFLKMTEQKRADNSLIWKPVIMMKDSYKYLRTKVTLRYSIIVNEEKKFVYFPIPKVANTSIGKVLNREHTFATKNKIKKNYENYFKFAMVRNPYDKIVSYYSDKIMGDKGKFKGLYWMLWKYKGKFYEDIPFKEFVKSICSIPEKKAEHHFKSQSYFITDKKGEIVVDYIGMFEDLDEEFKWICKRINLKQNTNLPKENCSKRKKDYLEYFDEETLRLIEERYKEDFKLFGFVRESRIREK